MRIFFFQYIVKKDAVFKQPVAFLTVKDKGSTCILYQKPLWPSGSPTRLVNQEVEFDFEIFRWFGKEHKGPISI